MLADEANTVGVRACCQARLLHSPRLASRLMCLLLLLQRKTPEELEVLHYANQVASAAHVQVRHTVTMRVQLAVLCLKTMVT